MVMGMERTAGAGVSVVVAARKEATIVQRSSAVSNGLRKQSVPGGSRVRNRQTDRQREGARDRRGEIDEQPVVSKLDLYCAA